MLDTRAKIVAYCEWGIKNSALIHYSQIQSNRLAALAKPRHLPQATDCSGFATDAYKDAGAPNPNRADGLWKPGEFYTGTMLECGVEVKVPLPGDLLLYNNHHVIVFMYVWHGAWIGCSHGQDIGPLAIFQHREALFQGYKPMIRSYLPRD